MSPSGIDYFARLIRNIAMSATQQPGSQELRALAEALIRLPPESNQRIAYNAVMDHAAFLKLGPSIKDVEKEHLGDFRHDDPGTDDPKQFLENLILDIDNLIEDAEIGANEESGDDLTEDADDVVNGRGNEIARQIASRKATEGAREAAEQAYKLAYEWAYDDLFQAAYEQALTQVVEPSTVRA